MNPIVSGEMDLQSSITKLVSEKRSSWIVGESGNKYLVKAVSSEDQLNELWDSLREKSLLVDISRSLFLHGSKESKKLRVLAQEETTKAPYRSSGIVFRKVKLMNGVHTKELDMVSFKKPEFIIHLDEYIHFSRYIKCHASEADRNVVVLAESNYASVASLLTICELYHHFHSSQSKPEQENFKQLSSKIFTSFNNSLLLDHSKDAYKNVEAYINEVYQ